MRICQNKSFDRFALKNGIYTVDLCELPRMRSEVLLTLILAEARSNSGWRAEGLESKAAFAS